MTGWHRKVLYPLLVSLTVLACSGDATEAANIRCSEAIDFVSELPVGFVPDALGVVAFQSARVNQLGRRGTDDDPDSPLRFAKIALLLQNGSAVLIHIDPLFEDRAALSWGGELSSSPGPAVRVGPCGSPDGAWTVFAGGIWVLEPGCISLVVNDADQTAAVDLPVGAPCS